MQNLLTPINAAVIQPCGHINASNASDFQKKLSAFATHDQHSALLVDMSQVESLDSAGLMALVSTLTLAQQLDKRFALCAISPAIRIIFELTRLDRVFEIFENRLGFEAAIAR